MAAGRGLPVEPPNMLPGCRNGHVEVLRWARENGCPWRLHIRDRAAAELGYTDNLGNLAIGT